jgi:hypothetical protein
MTLTKRAVGIFSNYSITEMALYKLKDERFAMDRVAIVGLDVSRRAEWTGAKTSDQLSDIGNLASDETKVQDSAQTGAVAGSTVGGLTGLLVGLGAIAIPGVGPVMLAGAMATAIATTVSGNLIGAALGGVAGGLIGLSIPEDRAKFYSDRVEQGDYLVMVEGNDTSIAAAQAVLMKYGITDWSIYDIAH